MRKWMVLVTAVAATSVFVACGSDSKSSSGSTTTTAGSAAASCGLKPVTPDVLTIVTSLPGPGFWAGSETDPTKLTSGYEYDLASLIQQKCGLSKFTVRNVGFDAIVAGTIKDYDLALSQISITPEREKVVKFSEPYFESNQGVLVRKGTKVATLADAKKIQWGVQTSTTAVDLLKRIKPDKEARAFAQLADVYTALDAGQIDAVLIDTAINLGEAAQSKGKFEVVSQFDQPGGPDKYGALFPKDSVNVAAVNSVLTDLKSSGELARLATKDLTGDPTTIPVIAVP
jgi:polar amino acid transport system substrate-binding protein